MRAGLPPRPFSISNEWADSIGGPAIKNKLFFFVDNEGLRYVLPGGGGAIYTPTPAFSSFVLNNLKTSDPAAIPFYTTALNLYARLLGCRAGNAAYRCPGSCSRVRRHSDERCFDSGCACRSRGCCRTGGRLRNQECLRSNVPEHRE